MRRIDSRPLRLREDDILVVSTVRNERLRLPWFLEYHRQCGVDRFFIVDNGSTDGSTEFLLAQQDVVLFATSDSYAQSDCGLVWIHRILSRYASGHWTLTLDADELFTYPGCESVPLARLVRYLDAVGADALETLLLDMYSDRAVAETRYVAGEPFLSSCPFFDASEYSREPGHRVPARGGPRERVFWAGRGLDHRSPFLSKTPLVRWSREHRYLASTHRLRGARTAELTGALLHFKFFEDFGRRAAEEVGRGEHFRGARQYRVYDRALREEPRLGLHHRGSVRYENSLQLVDLGLARMPEDFRAVVERLG